MKALTIYQPWATLIALEVKPYEFRGWDYAERYHSLQGSRIVIHASAREPKHKEIKDLVTRMRTAKSPTTQRHDLIATAGGTGLKPEALPILERILQGMEGRGPEFPLPLSAAVCTATIGKAVRADTLFGGRTPTNDSDRDEHALYAWPMLAVKTTAAVPCRGLQGFWNFPASLERDL